MLLGTLLAGCGMVAVEHSADGGADSAADIGPDSPTLDSSPVMDRDMGVQVPDAAAPSDAGPDTLSAEDTGPDAFDGGPPTFNPCPAADAETLFLFDMNSTTMSLTGGFDGAIIGTGTFVDIAGAPCGTSFEGGAAGAFRVDFDATFAIATGSVDFWLYLPPGAALAPMGIFGHDAVEQGVNHMLMLLTEEQQIAVRWQSLPGTVDVWLCSPPLEDADLDRWNHIGVNFGNAGPSLFVNGRLVSDGTVAGTFPGLVPACGTGPIRPAGFVGNTNPIVFGASDHASDEGSAEPLRSYAAGTRIDHVRMSGVARDFSAYRR